MITNRKFTYSPRKAIQAFMESETVSNTEILEYCIKNKIEAPVAKIARVLEEFHGVKVIRM